MTNGSRNILQNYAEKNRHFEVFICNLCYFLDRFGFSIVYLIVCLKLEFDHNTVTLNVFVERCRGDCSKFGVLFVHQVAVHWASIYRK